MNDACPHCGYSLSGLPANARCPDCGKSRYPERPRTQPPPPDRVLTKGGVRTVTPEPPPHPTDSQRFNTRFDAKFIQDHTTCSGCGYDLHGLRIGNPCPECGRTILAPETRARNDNLVYAPATYIRKLAIGFALMSVGVVALAASLMLLAGPRPAVANLGGTYNMQVPIMRFRGFISAEAGIITLLAAATLWFIGVLLVSGRRPVVGKPSILREKRWRKLSISARITQACLVGAPFVVLCGTLIASTNPIVHAIFLWTSVALLAIGMIGWWPTGLLASDLADWASDTDLETTIRYAVFGMGFCTLLTIMGSMLPLDFGGAAFMLWGWMLAAGALVSMVVFLFSTFRLTRLMVDALLINKGMAARDRRFVDKMNAERAAHQATLAKAPAEDTPDLIRKVATVPKPHNPKR